MMTVICENLRKSAVKYYLQNFYQVIVRNKQVFVCRVFRQTKKATLCGSAVKSPIPYLRKSA